LKNYNKAIDPKNPDGTGTLSELAMFAGDVIGTTSGTDSNRQGRDINGLDAAKILQYYNLLMKYDRDGKNTEDPAVISEIWATVLK